jgi:hypothetical protein
LRRLRWLRWLRCLCRRGLHFCASVVSI